MVFSPSLPPNHSKTTRILPDCSAAASRRGTVQDEWDRADAAEEAKAEAAGADPDHVAPRDAAVGQSTFACHQHQPFGGVLRRAGLELQDPPYNCLIGFRIRSPGAALKGALLQSRSCAHTQPIGSLSKPLLECSSRLSTS